MAWRFPLLLLLAVLLFPSSSWAACTFPDGSAAPEPGLLGDMPDLREWNVEFVELYNNLSKGDRSTLVAVLRQDATVLMTSRCSPNDLLWTHLSLVGMSEVDDGVVAEQLAERVRGYRLTRFGRDFLSQALRPTATQ